MPRAEISFIPGTEVSNALPIRHSRVGETEVFEGPDALKVGYQRLKGLWEGEVARSMLHTSIKRDGDNRMTVDLVVRAEDMAYRRRPLPEVTDILNKNLGSAIVAYALKERISHTLRYAAGRRAIPARLEPRLRDMAKMTEVLLQKDFSPALIQALLFGQNPAFEDRAPILVIREGGSARVAAEAPNFLEGYS